MLFNIKLAIKEKTTDITNNIRDFNNYELSLSELNINVRESLLRGK